MTRFTTCLLLLIGSTSTAYAEEPAAPAPAPARPGYPRVGGHVGLAIPLVVVADPVTGIGSDFTKIGLAPGVTVKLTDRWAIDFEMVAYSNFLGSANVSTLVIDPGLVYSFDFASVGLRSAVHVGQTQNWGFIPIINKGFPLGDGTVKAFVELDLPVFFNEAGASMTVQPQAGVAF
jgi:hypothetical protein